MGPATRSGLLQKLVVGRLKAFVLKFVAKKIVEEGVEYLERDNREQLLLVDSLDPAAWRPAETKSLSLPSDRPARILLLVHGTFSSTIGSFGAWPRRRGGSSSSRRCARTTTQSWASITSP